MNGMPPLIFSESDLPVYDRQNAYNRSEKGRVRSQRYEVKREPRPWTEANNARARARTLAAYLNREFVAWDGEGVNNPDGSHSYVLLASSDGAYLSNEGGLPTADVLELFLNARRDVTHIGYGLGYDINMILRDLDRDTLTHLYINGKVRWNGYHIEWRQGKSLAVRTRSRRFLIYDVLPFFQR